MHILVASDSHTYLSTLESILRRERGADIIVHLGDFSDDMARMTEYTAGKGVVICRGNCDFYGADYPELSVFEAEGKRIFCCHGHRYRVKDGLYALGCAAREQGADICLFGHTHSQLLEENDGRYILNPGAVCNGEYATIDLVNGEIKLLLKTI